MKLGCLQPLSPKPCWGSDPSEGGLKVIPWALKFLCMHQVRPLKSSTTQTTLSWPHSELLFPKLSWHVLSSYQCILQNYQPPDYVSRCHLLLQQEYTSKILPEKLFRLSTRNFFFLWWTDLFLSNNKNICGGWGWVSLGETKMTFYWNSHRVVSVANVIRLSEANSLCSDF